MSGGNVRQVEVIGPFFETHVLGIMAQLTDIINDGRSHQSLQEKRRCLGAIRKMATVAGNSISNALPQVSIDPLRTFALALTLTRLRHVSNQLLHSKICVMKRSRLGMSLSESWAMKISEY